MTSRKPLLTAVFVVPALLIASSLPAPAQPTSEERPVIGFTELRAERGVDVYLTQGTRESLRIEVDGYELANVISKVESNVLTLSRTEHSWGWPQGRVIAHVEFVQVTAISASAGSDVQGRDPLRFETLKVQASGGSDVDLDVQAQNLEFIVSGGSDLRLRGTTRSLAVEASGGSDASARSLTAERVRVRASGGSDASVHATAAIDIDASGGSDVQVSGNPAERRVDNDKSSDVIWR